MPANIEIKARVRDFAALRARAEALSNVPVQVIPQEDTFFNVAQGQPGARQDAGQLRWRRHAVSIAHAPHDTGRLKLRVLAANRAQLIFYSRPDQSGPKRSDYHIHETADPAGLKNVLALALGVRGVVRKTRYLYLAGETRIHLDDVEGLGQFMELEVVLRPDQTDAEGQAIAADLMSKLGVAETDLLDGAYMDLLESS